MVRGFAAAAQLNSILSTEIACRVRDVGWDPSQGTPCAAPSVRRARHTCLSGNGAHHVAPHPVNLRRSCGAAAERCVTITVHVPTPCRCSLLAASDPLSRPLTPAYGRPRWLLHLPPALGGKNPMCRKLRKSHTRHCLNRTRRPTSLGDSGHRHWANTSLRALRAVAPPLLSGLRGVVFGHLKGFGKVLITGSPLLAQSESQLRAGRAPPQVALRPTAHVKRHAVAPRARHPHRAVVFA